MEGQTSVFSSVAFWLSLCGTLFFFILSCLGYYLVTTVKDFKKNDDELFKRMRQVEKDLNYHLGKHNGLKDHKNE